MMTITNQERVRMIQERLQEALEPIHLSVIDDSHLHENHPEAKKNGGGHFSIEIISEQFTEKSAIERHRMIYVALGDTMGTDIHALSINAKTPEESAEN